MTRVTKCQCGHAGCNYYGTSDGVFYQGCGYDLQTAVVKSAAEDMLAALRAILDVSHPITEAMHLAECAVAKATTIPGEFRK